MLTHFLKEDEMKVGHRFEICGTDQKIRAQRVYMGRLFHSRAEGDKATKSLPDEFMLHSHSPGKCCSSFGLRIKYFQPTSDFQLVRGVLLCHVWAFCFPWSGLLAGHLCTNLHIESSAPMFPGADAKGHVGCILLSAADSSKHNCVQALFLLQLVLSLRLCLHGMKTD